MKINVNNFKKIQEALDVANGKCRTRLVNRWNVESHVIMIEKSLTTKGIPKKDWKGLKFSVQPDAEKLPNAYYKKGIPTATQFILERGSNSWFMIDAKRTDMRTNRIEMLSKFSEKHIESIINNAYKF